MPLSETAIRQAKSASKPIKMFDGRGLFLLIKRNGARGWRFKYRIDGREKLLSFGVYPDVPLKLARDRREAARQQLAAGIDPGTKRKAEKVAQGDTLEAIACEWLALQEPKLAPATFAKATWTLETLIFPGLGKRPIAKISAPDLLTVLRRIEIRGTYETAHRAKQRCGQVFRYAIATGRATHDITADLRGALAPVVTTNHAAITDPARVGELLRAIDGYRGSLVTSYALKLAPLTFVRPGELRHATWSEFDLDHAEWRIPAERMKMREQHIVPLSWQAVETLRELQSISCRSSFVFPALGNVRRPMSENTVNAALRRLGYAHDEMTGHGFRSMASTLLNEQGWHPDLIELQLAHAERNQVRAAYNRAQRLVERRKMMQAWADYLDQLKLATGGSANQNIRAA
ncbi:MAG: tyrosine-type recombinase/integrase, partial [Steroidobacteraceae bacterium]